MSRALLITGATGRQGGGVVTALLASHADFRIFAVTRDTTSASAQKLASRSSKINLLQGDLDDPKSIFQSAREMAKAPIWGVFSVQVCIATCLHVKVSADIPQTPGFAKDGPVNEERQGKALVDAAIKNDVKHFVYSSVDRNGDKSIRNATDVPHFASKHRIELHIMESAKGTDMEWTILRPVAFMENFDGGFFGKVFASAWQAVVKSRPLQLVSTDDIGAYAAKAFLHPVDFKGQSISLAGDELTYLEMAQVFKEVTGSTVPTTWGFLARLMLWMSKDMGSMFRFFEQQGYRADVAKVRKMYPGMKDLRTWLKESPKY